MARAKSPWARLQLELATFMGSARSPLLFLVLFGVFVVCVQLTAVHKMSAKEQPFEGFGILGKEEARRVVQETKSEARKLPAADPCPDRAREIFPEVIFSAREWLKPWSTDIHNRPEGRISKRTIDGFFAWLEKEGFAVARIRVTNGVLAKPVMVKQRGKQDPSYTKRVARWYLLFDTLYRTHGLPKYLDLIVSTETMPILPQEMQFADWPPIFGYFAYADYLDIPLPSFELYGRLSKWDKHMVLAHSWLSRNPKVFWRGFPVGGVKRKEAEYWRHHVGAKLVQLGKQFPELVDAKFEDCRPLGCPQAIWKEVYHSELTSEANVTYSDFLQHKFVVDIETGGLESRFSHLLSTMAVIMKPESPRTEFFDEFFTPFMHYVPVDANGADWKEKIDILNKDVVRASEISRAASVAFEEFVANDKWLDYAWALISAYALLLDPKH